MRIRKPGGTWVEAGASEPETSLPYSKRLPYITAVIGGGFAGLLLVLTGKPLVFVAAAGIYGVCLLVRQIKIKQGWPNSENADGALYACIGLYVILVCLNVVGVLL